MLMEPHLQSMSLRKILFPLFWRILSYIYTLRKAIRTCRIFVCLFFGCTQGMGRFPGQRSNMGHTRGNTGSLALWATRELPLAREIYIGAGGAEHVDKEDVEQSTKWRLDVRNFLFILKQRLWKTCQEQRSLAALCSLSHVLYPRLWIRLWQ